MGTSAAPVRIVGQRRFQPVSEELKRQRWTVARAAQEMGVTRNHLEGVCGGLVTPSPRLREQLPALLGLPLSALFEASMLERTYMGPIS